MLISEFYVLKIRKTRFFLFCFIFKAYDSIKLRSIDYNTEILFYSSIYRKGNSQNYCTQTGQTVLQKDWWFIYVPPSPPKKDRVLLA